MHNWMVAEESRDIFLIIQGDGLKQNYEIPADDKIPVSHMDVFPSIIEYLGLSFEEEWNLDGRSRIQWQDEKEDCLQSDIHPVIAFSGAYIYDDGSEEESQCAGMITTSGRLHYKTWMHYMRASQESKEKVGNCDLDEFIAK